MRADITHQQKKLNEDELRDFRARSTSRSRREVAKARSTDRRMTAEIEVFQKRREELGGHVPSRRKSLVKVKPPRWDEFAEFFSGSEGREVPSTMARAVAQPPDARQVCSAGSSCRSCPTSADFRHGGDVPPVRHLRPQRPAHEPVDSDTVLYYYEAKNGQILEEGITEAGSMASFIAAATAHSSHGINMIPFFIYYSMFGMQRIGDLIWAAGDMRCRGFLLGGTAGRIRSPAKGSSTRTATATSTRSPTQPCRPTTPATPTKWRRLCSTASGGCSSSKKTSSITSP